MNNLYVKVIEAKDIHGADLGGKSDPYCVLKINDEDINKKVKKRGKHWEGLTSTKTKTLNPKWNETYILESMPGDEESDFLRVQLFDHDKVSKDDSIGMCKIPLSTFVNGQPHDVWYDIKPMKKEKAKGKLHLLVHYCPVGVPFVRRDF
ncbi:c2 domain-containing protein [Anaeramoeba flamelloides]|uniref:C2 domain-containing protein n=1 Tax=Anaeramoeba flamelloides TaxID=1746091 RepID=A0AAV8A023_9EUKA|nr:c2 domain-containing protein [Anaeramoeba flamelloides]KAJ6229852.1 c2 domain-containing protein [Anaeramoeba flamelloides]